jgi:MFS family permease
MVVMSVRKAVAAGPSHRGSIYRHRAIDPIELPAIMRKHIYTGMMGSTYGTLLSGMFFVAYARQIGVEALGFGVLSAFCQFSVVGQLISAYHTNRSGQRKKLWYRSELFSRLLRLGAVVGSFLLFPYSPMLASVALLGLVIGSSFCLSLSLPPWQSWLSSIIPAHRHGRFMGLRSAWIALATLAVVLPCGYLLDRAATGQKMTMLAGIFAFGLAIGFVDLFIHRTIPEPAVPPDRQTRFFRQILTPLRDRRYRPWLVFRVAWHFSWMLGGAMALPYWLMKLGVEKNFLMGTMMLMGLPLLLATFTGKYIGVLVDRVGTRRVLIVSHLAWSTLPILWMLATPQTAMILLPASAAIGSLAFRGSYQAASKIQTRSAPPQRTAMYVATSTFAAAVAGGLGALTGGALVHLLGGLSLQVGWKVFGGFEFVFLLSLVGRFASSTLALRVNEPALAEPVIAKVAPPLSSPRPRQGVA